MKSVIEYLFSGDIFYPLAPEDDRRFGKLSELEETKRSAIEPILSPEIRDYLKILEDYHQMERRLYYESGFLTAITLCREVGERL